jgi:hypothetical protein
MSNRSNSQASKSCDIARRDVGLSFLVMMMAAALGSYCGIGHDHPANTILLKQLNAQSILNAERGALVGAVYAALFLTIIFLGRALFRSIQKRDNKYSLHFIGMVLGVLFGGVLGFGMGVGYAGYFQQNHFNAQYLRSGMIAAAAVMGVLGLACFCFSSADYISENNENNNNAKNLTDSACDGSLLSQTLDTPL